MTDPTTHADPAMRSIVIEIPIAVAHRITETFEGTVEDAARAGLKLLNGMGSAAYNNLQELAKQLDTSPAKALRSAIQLLVEDSARLNMTRGTVGRPKINEQRDAKLYERIKEGATHVQIAAEFNLSVVRVGQIAAQQRHANGDTPRRANRPAQSSRAHGQPNLMKMFGQMDAGLPADSAAVTYGMDTEQVESLYSSYRANLPVRAKLTAYDRMQATQQTMNPQPPKVLSLEDLEAAAQTPTPAPRKLAVIPPSMKNPELFAEAKPIKIPDFANLDNRMFEDDYPI